MIDEALYGRVEVASRRVMLFPTQFVVDDLDLVFVTGEEPAEASEDILC